LQNRLVQTQNPGAQFHTLFNCLSARYAIVYHALTIDLTPSVKPARVHS
jgi:hypothetical protein